MTGTSPANANDVGRLGDLAMRRFGKVLRETSKSSICIDSPTFGFALYDKSLSCKALGGAFSRVNGVAVKPTLAGPIRHVFGERDGELQLAIQRVFVTGFPLSDHEISVAPPASNRMSYWILNCYPIRDESGKVPYVALLFSEITKRTAMELKLRHLADKFRANESAQPGEDGDEISERSVELMGRSADMIRSSMCLRRHIFESRMVAELARVSLFVALSQEEPPRLAPDVARVRTSAGSPGRLGSLPEDGPSHAKPSPRECQVLHFLADGRSNKQIGAILELSTRTVENYRAHIMAKLGLHSTAELVRYAIRNDLAKA